MLCAPREVAQTKLFSHPLITCSRKFYRPKEITKLFAQKKRLGKRMPLVYNKLLLLGPLSHTLSLVLTHYSPSPSLHPLIIQLSCLQGIIVYVLSFSHCTTLLEQANCTVLPLTHTHMNTNIYTDTYGGASYP